MFSTHRSDSSHMPITPSCYLWENLILDKNRFKRCLNPRGPYTNRSKNNNKKKSKQKKKYSVPISSTNI